MLLPFGGNQTTLYEVAGGVIGFTLVIGAIYHTRRRYRKWLKRQRKQLLDDNEARPGIECRQIETKDPASEAYESPTYGAAGDGGAQ